MMILFFRVWSKKYPIQIRTNARKPRSSPETSRKMAALPEADTDTEVTKDADDGSKSASASSKSSWSSENDNFDEIMFDAKEDFSDNDDVKSGQKTTSTSTTVRRRKLASTSAASLMAATPTPTTTDCDKKGFPSGSEKSDDVAASFVVVPEEEAYKTYYLFSRWVLPLHLIIFKYRKISSSKSLLEMRV